MSKRQIFLNALLVCVLIGFGCFFYQKGKSYNILFENLAFEIEGEQRPPLEAVYVYLDGGRQTLILDGDKTIIRGIGATHRLKMELLDDQDQVIDIREFSFSMDDLGKEHTLNIAKAFWLVGENKLYSF